MRRIGQLVATVALLLGSGSAMAFDVQQEGKTPAKEPSASAPLLTDKDIGANFSISEPGKAGTEVRIPGIGKVGVLPKMDFGLELLYGAAEQKPIEQPAESAEQTEELMIRGTVKHRF
jgi:hypothetical protein